MHTSPSRLTIALAAAALGGGLLLTAIPAQAASAAIAAPSGMSGMAETVWISAPASRSASVPVTFSLNGSTVSTLSVTTNRQGAGTVDWVPSDAGTWTISAAGASTNVTVYPMPTQSTVYTANALATGVANTIVASVQSTGGTAPTGTVTVRNVFTSAAIGTATLVAGPGGVSTASLTWTPTDPALYPIQLTYNPAPGSGFGTSLSPVWTADVQSNPPLVALRLPPTLIVNQPVTVTGVVTNWALSGTMSLDLNVNGTASSIAPSQTVSNSTVSSTWTPTALGNQVVTASFTGTPSSTGTPNGVANQAVNVRPALPADPISVTPSWRGPLTVGAPAAIRYGTPLTLTTSSGSGNPVTLNATGACAISGSVLFATGSRGTCTLTAHSAGNMSYQPATAQFTLNVLGKTKK